MLDAAVADIFGYHAVQIGLPHIDFLRANRMPQRHVVLTPEDDVGFTANAPSLHSVLRADGHELPFANDSVDLILLPHVLEFSPAPHQMLREVERVLRPEGQVIITGFNPVSLWGVKRQFGGNQAPWNSEFISLFRAKDWLKLLNLEVSRGRYGCYRPPFDSQKWLDRFGFLERLGQRWWPIAGGTYLVQAVKRVNKMRLVGMEWKKPKLRSARLAIQSQRASQRSSPRSSHRWVRKVGQSVRNRDNVHEKNGTAA